eukprot:m.129101 g.129101  ORF g.129101 m.129101 type:complete len:792 (+) comp29375_c0_seq12:86-2461(+)
MNMAYTSSKMIQLSVCVSIFVGLSFGLDPGDGTASWGIENIKVSGTGPENLLPSFFFMAGGEEGGSYSTGDGYHGGLGDAHPFEPPDTCPDDVFQDTSPDLRVPVLPYLEQDDWGCERVPTNVSVIVLENEYLRAAITPQYGGKIWSLYHKKEKRQLLYNNPAHQPDNIGYRKAWTSGGCEWNWAPGYIGHSVFTESPTFAAKIPTERGDIVRVWEFDRLNFTVWQVDMFLEKDILWVHPKITNPRPIDLRGYWWTCVAMRVEESGKTRIVTPADLSITPCTAWPSGAYTLANVSFRGSDIDTCDKSDGGTCAWQQDMSYLGNIPFAHDFFMFKAGQETKYPHRPQQPYIAHVLEDGYTVVHGHPLNGTKFFTWGEADFGTFQQDFMSDSDYQNPKCYNDMEVPHYDPYCKDYEHVGKYTELQIGPARSQMHTFPLPKWTNETKGEYQWTEWFKGYQANASLMHSGDYNVPLTHVLNWMDGVDGIPAETIKSTDAWLKEMSSVAPKPEEILFKGTEWGGLHEKLTGKPLAAGCPFEFMNTSKTRPWIELLETGRFSTKTHSSVPESFLVADAWLSLLKRSLAKEATWLTYLYIGTALLERGEVDGSTDALTKSMSMKPSIHAARALAVSAPDDETARAYFLEAWSVYKLSEKTEETIRLGTNLASELTIWLTYKELWTDLKQLFGDIDLTADMRVKDRVLHARIALAIEEDEPDVAQAIIKGHCFPTYGGDRNKLIALWEQSFMMQEEKKQGRPLTYFEQVLVRRRIGCIGDGSYYPNKCNRGPPNIGYAY